MSSKPRSKRFGLKRRARKSPPYLSLTERERGEYNRAINLLSSLRQREASYSALLRKYHLSRRKAERFLGRNLVGGGRGRRVRASKTDRLVRELFVPTPVGDISEPVRGLAAASKLSEFYRDRRKLLLNRISADDFEAKWRGVRVNGQELFADADGIFRMANAGVLEMENLYASVGYEK